MKRRGCVTATLCDAYVGWRRIARRVVSYNTCHTWHAVKKKKVEREERRGKKSATRSVGRSVDRSVAVY